MIGRLCIQFLSFLEDRRSSIAIENASRYVALYSVPANLIFSVGVLQHNHGSNAGVRDVSE